MTVVEALEVLRRVLDLNKAQEIVFRQAWEGQSYTEIARSSGYEVGYIRDVGSKLWQLLSKVFVKKITKKNFQGVLKRQHAANFYPTTTGVGICPTGISLVNGDATRSQTVQTHSVFAEELHQSQVKVLNQLITEGSTDYQCQDWGEAIDVSSFYGRAAELATLRQWIVQDRCRLLVLLGMGGIGKTALTMKLAEQIQDEFEYVIWRSLRNAPLIKDLLTAVIQFLSSQEAFNLPETVDGQISYLLKYLRQYRCLLVLDNSESILRSGERGGHYCEGYEGYGQLLRRVGDEHHQSSLILTSREKPIGLAAKEGETSPMRSLQLTGLQQGEGQAILEAKGLVEVEDKFKKLIERYTGNPLALKIAATMIQSLFDGDVSRFFEQGTMIFGEIWELLDKQFSRLSAIEKEVMYRLALNREWVTLPELQENILLIVSHRELLEAVESLQQRSLIEKRSAGFALKPIVMEYMTERLISSTD